MPRSPLIKGRYAAFFLSLQYTNNLRIEYCLKVFHFKHFVSTSPPAFDHHDVILLFADQAASDWRVYRNEILLKIRLIIANNTIGLLFVGVGFSTVTVAPKITRPLFGIW